MAVTTDNSSGAFPVGFGTSALPYPELYHEMLDLPVLGKVRIDDYPGASMNPALNSLFEKQENIRNLQAAQNAEYLAYAAEKRSQAYNTEMANTAYQRVVADMKAAGINPLLAISQGGASSPVSVSEPRSARSVGSRSAYTDSALAGMYFKLIETGAGLLSTAAAYNQPARFKVGF